MKKLLFLFVWLWSALVFAQERPVVVSTLQTTDTTANSMKVGCAVGSSSCTGTITAGLVTANALGAEAGYVEIQSNVPSSTTFRLYNNSGTLMWNGATLAIGGSISGTTNTIPLFTASNAVGNSIMTQSGTTITVANTLAATTVTATTLTGTLSTASQTNVTGVGTITTGTWNATAIGPQWGGTGANLSGTGGTSQFLRQASVGAAITVVRPAVADLSDASNVALLNASNTFTGGNQIVQSAVAAGGLILKVNNTQAAGAGQYGGLELDADNAAIGGFIRQYSNSSGTLGFTGGALSGSGAMLIENGGTSGMGLYAAAGAGVISFYTGGSTSQRWGINSAGDFTVGSSSDIALSAGTPSTFSGFGTGGGYSSGTDYGFFVTTGTTANTGGVIAFGHTFANAPTCTVTPNAVAIGTVAVSATSSTQMSILYGSTSTNTTLHVHCLGR